MTKLYTARATIIGGRDGSAKTDDNRLSVKLSRTDSSDTGTNPEQLFACGYGACFGSAIAAIAKKDNVTLPEIKVEPEVSLNKDADAYFLDVVLNVTLDGVEQETAEKIVKTAHDTCPYSKAMKNNVEVKLKVNGKEIS